MVKKKQKDNFDFIDFLNAKYGSKDSDHDGLTDEVEVFLGTDPLKSDTDGDGVSDAAEIRAGRNPLGPGDFHDWFIPHVGNNYHPHVLHPKRLMFYATSAVIMKILVVIFVLGLPMTAWLSPDLLKEQAAKIIELTNAARAEVGAPALTENQILNQAAYAKASDMILQQYFSHVGPDKKTLIDWLKDVGYRYEVAGENLAMGFVEPAKVMAAWRKSQTHYANIIDKDFSEIGVGAVNGPYKGEGTVFVAQFFGQPVPAVTSIIHIHKTTSEEERLSAISTVQSNQTLKQQIAPTKISTTEVNSLEKPVALGLSQGLITKLATADIKIFAAGASQVWLEGKNGKVSAQLTEDTNAWQLTLKLFPGKNIFYLVAKNASDQIVSDNYEIIFDNEPPLIDSEKTKLFLDLPQGLKEAVAKAEVYLSDDTVKAQLSFSDYHLDLQPINGVWLGQLVIADRQKLEPLVPPDLKVSDAAGNEKIYNLSWANLEAIKSSRADRYLFLRANPETGVAKIFGFSDWFYRTLLFGAVMSLCLAVGVEIKKQRPKLIISTASLIILLICLLIF